MFESAKHNISFFFQMLFSAWYFQNLNTVFLDLKAVVAAFSVACYHVIVLRHTGIAFNFPILTVWGLTISEVQAILGGGVLARKKQETARKRLGKGVMWGPHTLNSVQMGRSILSKCTWVPHPQAGIAFIRSAASYSKLFCWCIFSTFDMENMKNTEALVLEGSIWSRCPSMWPRQLLWLSVSPKTPVLQTAPLELLWQELSTGLQCQTAGNLRDMQKVKISLSTESKVNKNQWRPISTISTFVPKISRRYASTAMGFFGGPTPPPPTSTTPRP